jgi:small subunit ribosomal protein S7
VVEVKSRRVGGANYQVPVEVRPCAAWRLSMRWIREAARKRSREVDGRSVWRRVAGGGRRPWAAMKKREEVHRMAEANKAFSHFRF